MGIPDYQSLMLPLLELASDQQEHSIRQAVDALANRFGLTDADRRELLSSGRQRTFDNRVGWARTYLGKAELLESPRRGIFRITSSGMQVISAPPPSIDVAYLMQFPGFVEFRGLRGTSNTTTEGPVGTSSETPEESLEIAYQRVREDLFAELLQMVKAGSPQFFEQLVVDLLVSMGYGGTRQDAGKAVGGTGDGGIDGVINEDLLGLDTVYIQAKRWDNPVGRPEVQRFAGALQGNRSRKGVLLTTSSFSKHAQEYIATIDSRIVLIDGPTLAQLMVDHNVGVTAIASYEIKKIDSDYFTES
jgi:restriction system protein